MADVEVVLSAKDETKSHVIEDNRLSVKDKTVSEIDTTGDDSEYETLEEDNGLDDDDDDEDDEEEEGELLEFRRGRRSETEEGDLSDGESVIIEDERVDGDGEEESEPLNDRKLDDDEDRRNPQYIPKKGTFYEHDDRTLLDAEGKEEEGSKETSPNDVDDSIVSKKEDGQEAKLKKTVGPGGGKSSGKVWVDKAAEKWQHDLYNDDEQRPKTTQELIDTYGYDIRNEEAPPKARRRRRYGRGPNKYTRNWEDEDAYRSASLPIAVRGRGRGGRGRGRTGRAYRGVNDSSSPVSSREEFPVLGEQRPRRSISKPRNSSGSGGGPSSPSLSVPIKKIPKHFNARAISNDRNQSYLSEHLSTKSNNVPASVPVDLHQKDSSVVLAGGDNTSYSRGGRGRGRTRGGGGAGAGSSGGGGDADISSKYKLEFTSSRGRGQRMPPPAFSSLGKQSSIASVPSAHISTTNAKFTPSVTSVTKKFNNIEISSCTFTPNNAEENSRAVVRESVSSGANERRVVTEVPPRMQEASSVSVSRSKRYSAQRQRSLPESTYSPPPPATPPQQAQQQQAQHQHQQQHPLQYYQPQTQPISVPDYPPPPVFNEAVPPPQMVTFIPPGPPPPPVTAPPFPPPPIINYVPTPAAFHTMPLQPPPTVQQAELFQGQNGITYYSTQTQAALPRQTPPRRVKLAIPILPPPDQAPRGRGRSTEQDAKA